MIKGAMDTVQMNMFEDERIDVVTISRKKTFRSDVEVVVMKLTDVEALVGGHTAKAEALLAGVRSLVDAEEGV